MDQEERPSFEEIPEEKPSFDETPDEKPSIDENAEDRSSFKENTEVLTTPVSRVTWIALIMSLIAVAGIIFILLTNNKKPAPDTPRAVSVTTVDGKTVSGTRIAFVRADSVQDNYLMTIHFLDSIEKRFKSMENDLLAKKTDLQKKVQNYYRDVQSGLLKESTALQIKERIEAEGDKLGELEENYSNRINDLQVKLNIIYFDSLWNFVERHKADFGVDMVLGYQQGLTNIFFADDSMDITGQVIERMNEEYLAKYPDRRNMKKKKK